MRFSLFAAVLLLGSAGCAVPADPAEDETREGTNAQAAMTSNDLVPFGFTHLDFTADNTMVATLVDRNVAPIRLTLVSTDWFNKVYYVTVYLQTHDTISGKAKYVNASQTGPSLALHNDCGDPTLSPSGTLAPKYYVYVTPLVQSRYTVQTITNCIKDARKPPNPPNCY